MEGGLTPPTLRERCSTLTIGHKRSPVRHKAKSSTSPSPAAPSLPTSSPSPAALFEPRSEQVGETHPPGPVTSVSEIMTPESSVVEVQVEETINTSSTDALSDDGKDETPAVKEESNPRAEEVDNTSADNTPEKSDDMEVKPHHVRVEDASAQLRGQLGRSTSFSTKRAPKSPVMLPRGGGVRGSILVLDDAAEGLHQMLQDQHLALLHSETEEGEGEMKEGDEQVEQSTDASTARNKEEVAFLRTQIDELRATNATLTSELQSMASLTEGLKARLAEAEEKRREEKQLRENMERKLKTRLTEIEAYTENKLRSLLESFKSQS